MNFLRRLGGDDLFGPPYIIGIFLPVFFPTEQYSLFFAALMCKVSLSLGAPPLAFAPSFSAHWRSAPGAAPFHFLLAWLAWGRLIVAHMRHFVGRLVRFLRLPDSPFCRLVILRIWDTSSSRLLLWASFTLNFPPLNLLFFFSSDWADDKRDSSSTHQNF